MLHSVFIQIYVEQCIFENFMSSSQIWSSDTQFIWMTLYMQLDTYSVYINRCIVDWWKVDCWIKKKIKYCSQWAYLSLRTRKKRKKTICVYTYVAYVRSVQYKKNLISLNSFFFKLKFSKHFIRKILQNLINLIIFFHSN